jgi:hypothetical protein
VKKITFIIVFSVIATFAQQQETPYGGSTNNSVYLHPISLIVSLFSLENTSIASFTFISLTGEFPLSGRYALIVNPSLFLVYESKDEPPGEAFFIGSGFGIRRFVNGNADGLYLQLMPNVHYFEGNNGKISVSGLNMDILGHIGYSIKYSKINFFFDIGTGYGFSHYFSLDKELTEEDTEGDINYRFFGGLLGSKNGLSFDINIGIGIPLL